MNAHQSIADTGLRGSLSRLRSRVAPQAGEGERGSVSIFIALTAVVMILLVGLAVDLGGQVHARQRATDLAAQAARVGGQRVQVAPAVHGHTPGVDLSIARAAATSYLTSCDLTGTVTIEEGTTLVVTTHATYHTLFLGIIGLTDLPVTGHATASLIRAVDGNRA